MAIHSVKTSKGVRYIVDYRDLTGQRHRRRFAKKSDATAFEAQVVSDKAKGMVAAPADTKTTFADFASRWLLEDAKPEYDSGTYELYKWVLTKHVAPRIGGYKLVQVAGSVEPTKVLAKGMKQDKVGANTRRKALVLVGQIVRAAMERELVHQNMATLVKKPPAKREKQIRPFSCELVELVRVGFERPRAGRSRYARLQDSALAATIGYSGLRPEEARAIEWVNLGERVWALDVTKTDSPRVVPIEEPLWEILLELRAAQGDADDSEPVFRAHSAYQQHWSESGYDNWRSRQFKRVVQDVASERPEYAKRLEQATPYYLRHTAAAIWLASGIAPIAVAERMGHSLAVLSSTYAATIEEVKSLPQIPAAQAISEAIKAVRGQEGGHFLDSAPAAAASRPHARAKAED